MSTETIPTRETFAAALPLPEGEVPRWVMIARAGRWDGHPNGPEVVTPDHLRSALDYFARHHRAHGADLPVDYHHASVFAAQGRVAKAPAAGWVRSMELRADGEELWGEVLWTAEAARAIAGRQFRHVSPVLRFGAPDRISGRPVPMLVHSVALTNTPFLTELQALNENAGTEAGATAGRGDHARPVSPATDGGGSMPILNQMAEALARKPEQVASALGLASAETDDRSLAERLVAGAQRLRGARLVVNALGVPEDADEEAFREAAGRMTQLRERLGLAEDADGEAVLNAVQQLCGEREDRAAEALVDGAVEAGRIPPSQREFFLHCARQDLEGTRQCINGLAPLMREGAVAATPPPGRPARQLTEGERSVCRQLGLDAAAFLSVA